MVIAVEVYAAFEGERIELVFFAARDRPDLEPWDASG